MKKLTIRLDDYLYDELYIIADKENVSVNKVVANILIQSFNSEIPIRERLDEIDKTKPVYVMCQSGLRSYISTRILEGNGYEAYNFAGGYRLYNVLKNEEEAAKNTYPCGLEK